MSKNRHASYMVQRALLDCGPPECKIIADEILGRHETLILLCRDQFGNPFSRPPASAKSTDPVSCEPASANRAMFALAGERENAISDMVSNAPATARNTDPFSR